MTIPMPEPVAWATPDLSKLFGENEMRTLEVLGGSREKQKTVFSTPLITTTQAEAYADARVREALEEAESIVRNNADACSTLAVKVMLHSNADAIRALIPPLSGPVEP